MRIQIQTIVIFDIPQDEEKEKEFLRVSVKPFKKTDKGYVWGFCENEYNGQKQRIYSKREFYPC